VLRAAQVGDRAPATAGGPPTISGLPQFRLELEEGSAVTACGRGLIGRQPVPAVDEHVDHYVTLADDTRVVSTPSDCARIWSSFTARMKYPIGERRTTCVMRTHSPATATNV